MGRAFFYGELAANYPEVVRPFVAAAGGRKADIALLLGGSADQDRWVPAYRDPMLAAGARSVSVLYAAPELQTLDSLALERLRTCTGIFVGGGLPRRYHQLYARSEAGQIIRERCHAGVPYGGLSSGALIAAERCTLAGSRVAEAGRSFAIHARHHLEGEGERPLLQDEGLGILRETILEVHCSEWGAFPRLVAALERSGARRGLGIDEPACVELQDEAEGQVHGQGRVYWLERQEGERRFALRVLEPGERFSF